MQKSDTKLMISILKELNINTKVKWNLSPNEIEKICIQERSAKKTKLGAIAIDTGKFTGRAPKDRYIVEDNETKEKVWWGDVNKPFPEENFNRLKKKIISHLNSKKEIYARNCFACANEKYQLNITVISETAWASLFAYNMFLRTSMEIKDFKKDWTIICAPSFHAEPKEDKTRKENFAIISFKNKEIIIGGTGYTGEIKKGIFSVLNFLLPIKSNVLSMHCSANIGKKNDTALFFGLSGTGKTTLSAHKERKLIGDDEHGWDQDSIFNFEGGCYAKCIDLSYEKEPDIYSAIKSGALLENICFKNGTNEIDFSDSSKTENTRVSYPIHHIKNIAQPSIGDTPKNIFFLTADAFGVLPPVSKLKPNQAMFHFISGYTAKVAGTEDGILEPEATFSTCFGAPFMPLHPTIYAKMLSQKIKDHNVNVWLINTGWVSGPYGTGYRIKLNHTRSIIEAALNNDLNNAEYEIDEIFGLQIPKYCPDVPSQILKPWETWKDKESYLKQAKKLAILFNKNFKKFNTISEKDILLGGPIFKS